MRLIPQGIEEVKGGVVLVLHLQVWEAQSDVMIGCEVKLRYGKGHDGWSKEKSRDIRR